MTLERYWINKALRLKNRPPLQHAADGPLGIPGTVRASFSLYNDEVDGDRLISGIEKAQTFL